MFFLIFFLENDRIDVGKASDQRLLLLNTSSDNVDSSRRRRRRRPSRRQAHLQALPPNYVLWERRLRMCCLPPTDRAYSLLKIKEYRFNFCCQGRREGRMDIQRPSVFFVIANLFGQIPHL
jgi:hypothetical protein